MEDLRRLGGEAGIVAGVALGWLALGMLVLFPASGLSFGAQLNPHKYLGFVYHHGYMYWAVNILGGLLAAAMSIILYLAVGDRFTNDAPATSRIGSLLGVLGAAAFAATALLRQFGIGPLAALYNANQVGAVHAFRGMIGVLIATKASGQIFTGLAALAFASAMLSEKKYHNAGIVAVVTGAATILATFISNAFLDGISILAIAVWFGWTSMMVREEAGPAFFKWQYAGAPTKSRRAA